MKLLVSIWKCINANLEHHSFKVGITLFKALGDIMALKILRKRILCDKSYVRQKKVWLPVPKIEPGIPSEVSKL